MGASCIWTQGVSPSWRRAPFLRPLWTLRFGYQKDTVRRFIFTPSIGHRIARTLSSPYCHDLEQVASTTLVEPYHLFLYKSQGQPALTRLSRHGDCHLERQFVARQSVTGKWCSHSILNSGLTLGVGLIVAQIDPVAAIYAVRHSGPALAADIANRHGESFPLASRHFVRDPARNQGRAKLRLGKGRRRGVGEVVVEGCSASSVVHDKRSDGLPDIWNASSF